MSSKVNKAREYLDKEVEFCLGCQPHDEGETIWMKGDQISIEELLEKYNLTDDQYDEVFSDYNCPGCGSELSRYDDVGIISKIDRKLKRKYELITKLYFPKMESFSDHLEKYPYLGLSHPTGKELSEFIHLLPKKQIKNEIWFRARLANSPEILIPKNFLNPNPSKIEIGEGRYNHYGQSHFYCSENELSAIAEILGNQEGIAWVQKIEIINANKILDVSIDYFDNYEIKNLIAAAMVYSRILTRSVVKSNYWKPEYFVSRFVADLAKSLGYFGIIYSGAEHHHKNLVIFDLLEIAYKFRGKPRIRKIINQKRNPFWLP